MPNRGEIALRLRTQGAGGKEIATTFQVASVTRPLWSVARICDAGSKVVSDPTGAEILDENSKVTCTFNRVGNLYKARFDLKIQRIRILPGGVKGDKLDICKNRRLR